MEDLATSTIAHWLTLLKATRPVPAAVSLCAISAAGAISLALKIAAILKEKQSQEAEHLNQLLELGQQHINDLLRLAQADAEAVEHWFLAKDEQAKAQMITIPEQIYQISNDAYHLFANLLNKSHGSKRQDVQAAINLLKITGLICKRIALSNKESL